MFQNYSSYASSLPCLFPALEEIIRIEYEGSEIIGLLSENSKRKYANADNYYAVAEGNLLTIVHIVHNEEEVDSEIVSEIEFENELALVSWDVTGGCLALCDSGNTIHLVRRTGLLLFSKQVFSGMECPYCSFIDHLFTFAPVSMFLFSRFWRFHCRVAFFWRDFIITVIMCISFKWINPYYS
jgi:hypothetical protein